MQVVKVEVNHSGSFKRETLPRCHDLGTELVEEGAVLQVIQIFLQYLSSTCCLQLFLVAMAADVTFF